MNQCPYKSVLYFTLFLLFMNCAALRPQRPLETERAMEAAEGNPYYHYLESQLQKKKGNLDAAIVHIGRAAEQDPESLFIKKGARVSPSGKQ